MFCPQCGREYSNAVNYCSHCGAAMCSSAPPATKKLYLSRKDRKLAGVCGGFAEYLDLDATIVRLVWVMTVLFVGWGVLGYLIAWLVIPEEPLFHPAPAPGRMPEPAPSGSRA
ncbi:MAG TPA: PspC domain-containing protein [Candidatus Solibacter sp.]|nr:PspC domain-containing protein [Candidatus Solibacter sp.]